MQLTLKLQVTLLERLGGEPLIIRGTTLERQNQMSSCGPFRHRGRYFDVDLVPARTLYTHASPTRTRTRTHTHPHTRTQHNTKHTRNAHGTHSPCALLYVTAHTHATHRATRPHGRTQSDTRTHTPDTAHTRRTLSPDYGETLPHTHRATHRASHATHGHTEPPTRTHTLRTAQHHNTEPRTRHGTRHATHTRRTDYGAHGAPYPQPTRHRFMQSVCIIMHTPPRRVTERLFC